MSARITLAATIAGAALALTACSGSDDSEDSEDFADWEDVPACSDVWIVGETLPDPYEGCMDGDSLVAAVFFTCDDPANNYTSYEDALHAQAGGEITDRAGAAADFYAECNGEEKVTGSK